MRWFGLNRNIVGMMSRPVDLVLNCDCNYWDDCWLVVLPARKQVWKLDIFEGWQYDLERREQIWQGYCDLLYNLLCGDRHRIWYTKTYVGSMVACSHLFNNYDIVRVTTDFTWFFNNNFGVKYRWDIINIFVIILTFLINEKQWKTPFVFKIFSPNIFLPTEWQKFSNTKWNDGFWLVFCMDGNSKVRMCRN